MEAELHQMKLINPSILIYSQYESQILTVRNRLFSSLRLQSEGIANAAEKILDKKVSSRLEKNIPHLFEIFPWLLGNLTNLEFSKAQEISVNWLALYLYVTFLDDYLDFNTKIEPDEFIAASVLAQSGLINLFKIVDNTKYEVLFRESLFLSGKNELKDVLEQALVHSDSFGKSESASGKNAILLACASAVAASTESDSSFIIDLTHELLLSIQLFDDLTDLEEDFRRGNITILLNEIKHMNSSSLTRNTILGLLLQSKSLYRIIEKIEISLLRVIALIAETNINHDSSNSARAYFQLLFSNIVHIRLYLESIEVPYDTLTPTGKSEVIEDLESKLAGIYCHT